MVKQPDFTTMVETLRRNNNAMRIALTQCLLVNPDNPLKFLTSATGQKTERAGATQKTVKQGTLLLAVELGFPELAPVHLRVGCEPIFS